MKMLIYFEKKKILRRRSTMIACMLMLLCIGTISLVIISDQYYYGEDGTELSGAEAIRTERKLVHAQAGPLNQECLKNALHQYQEVYGDPENYDSMTGSLREDIYLKSILPYRGILNLIREACVPAGTPGFYDMSVLSAGVTDESVDRFYEMRNVRIQEMLDMDYTAGNFTRSEKETFRKMNQQVSEPFSYDYSGGWKGLLVRSFPMLFLLIGLAVCIIISPIFAYEYQTGTDAVVLSSKYGRCETVRAKIVAGFLVTSGIYALAVLCNFEVYLLFSE